VYMKSSFEVGGYRVDVIDTAGLRESECPIEREGIRRSRYILAYSG
jgi:tRNA modification GTPase